MDGFSTHCNPNDRISTDYPPTEILMVLGFNANIHGRSKSVQLYTTSATISGTKFGPETHLASPINVVTQVFHYLSK